MGDGGPSFGTERAEGQVYAVDGQQTILRQHLYGDDNGMCFRLNRSTQFLFPIDYSAAESRASAA